VLDMTAVCFFLLENCFSCEVHSWCAVPIACGRQSDGLILKDQKTLGKAFLEEALTGFRAQFERLRDTPQSATV
jgi:hypothetical protein